MGSLRIFEVARQSGLQISTIRDYELMGIVDKPVLVARQRRYDESVLIRLRIVRRAQAAGFTLEEIAELFMTLKEGGSFSEKLRDLSMNKLKELSSRIHELLLMRRALLGTISVPCGTLEAWEEALSLGRTLQLNGHSSEMEMKLNGRSNARKRSRLSKPDPSESTTRVARVKNTAFLLVRTSQDRHSNHGSENT
jgi:DNA-binding transcriptional MerR regulator